MNTRKLVPGLADRLKAARTQAGLSQVSAGDIAGVHPVSIAKYETDKTVPTLDVLYQLASAYGVTVCSLLPEGERVPDRQNVTPPTRTGDGKKGARQRGNGR